MINKRFLNFKTYNGFLAKKDQIPEDSIVFIQDKPCIRARGKEYVCDGPYSAKATNGLFQFKNGKDEVIFTISQNNGILTLTDSKGGTTIIDNTITVDTELSLSSSNPLANWTIYSALKKKVDSTVLP